MATFGVINLYLHELEANIVAREAEERYSNAWNHHDMEVSRFRRQLAERYGETPTLTEPKLRKTLTMLVTDAFLTVALKREVTEAIDKILKGV